MEELLKKDLVEGKEAFGRLDALVGKVLSVRREEILRRDAEHKPQRIFVARNAALSLSSPFPTPLTPSFLFRKLPPLWSSFPVNCL
jgi:hypothetical protein